MIGDIYTALVTRWDGQTSRLIDPNHSIFPDSATMEMGIHLTVYSVEDLSQFLDLLSCADKNNFKPSTVSKTDRQPD